jgi:hypothetical protein
MEKSQVAELVLDARSLWQMYYVEGIIAKGYIKKGYFWKMKSEMSKLAGLDQDLRNGCPLCKYFFRYLLFIDKDKCEMCPLDWPRKMPSTIPPCERKGSPYELWHNEAKTIKQARAACEGMMELCEKWLDENHFSYEK